MLRGVESRFRHCTDLHEVEKTGEPWLYTSGVVGAVKLSVRLSDGKPREYSLESLFAETEDVKPGETVFDINVHGTTELANLDIVASSVGQNIAVSRKLDRVTCVNGKLDIELVPRAGKPPRIYGIIIKSAMLRR